LKKYVANKTTIFWQTIDYSSLLVEEWNGEFTVFQRQARKTHFLNQMGLLILQSLGNNVPISENSICSILAEQFHQKNDSKFSEQVIKTLHRFDELGLIEEAESENAVCE